jgi:hypothetical protein
VLWTDWHFCLGRFPLLDRIDYIDHTVALMERERVRPVRLTLEEIHVIWLARPPRCGIPEPRWFHRTEAACSSSRCRLEIAVSPSVSLVKEDRRRLVALGGQLIGDVTEIAWPTST